MHIHKIVYIKTFKIAPKCFDPKIIFREKHCVSSGMQLQTESQAAYHTTHIVRRTLSSVPFAQYDMLPQHQINIRNYSVNVSKNVTLARNSVAP